MQSLFWFADQDKDALVNYDQFASVFKDCEIKLEQMHILNMFQFYDKLKSGFIKYFTSNFEVGSVLSMTWNKKTFFKSINGWNKSEKKISLSQSTPLFNCSCSP